MQRSTFADRIAATGQLERLRSAAGAAAELGLPLYWVGGGIRDLMLGRQRLDLDLVVQGDVDVLASRLTRTWGGERTLHARFQTATLRPPDGTRIDLSRARRERYAAVAQLPEIEPASLGEDLARRDFTVNAMAIVLAPESRFGELVDPLGGRTDLAASRLRIHHARSFLDDPTRILRGVRFELRFGFHFDVETERLAREAVACGAVKQLGSRRFTVELARLFEDGAEPRRILERLVDLGLCTELAIDRVRWSRPAEAPPGLEQERWRSALLDLACSCDAATRERLVRRLALSARDRDLVRAGPDRVAAAAASLAALGRAPSLVLGALAPLSDEELARTAGESDAAREWIERYLRELRPFRLAIGGGDLLAAGVEPGPELGRALRQTLEARLDGRIGAAEELRFALEQCRGEGS